MCARLFCGTSRVLYDESVSGGLLDCDENWGSNKRMAIGLHVIWIVFKDRICRSSALPVICMLRALCLSRLSLKRWESRSIAIIVTVWLMSICCGCAGTKLISQLK